MDLLEKFALKKKKKTMVLTNVGRRAVGGVLYTRRICAFEKFRTISSGYLKISRIKESPQFECVKKLQRIVGFQIIRGGYLFGQTDGQKPPDRRTRPCSVFQDFDRRTDG
jgi:hypothetical protein